ncbi:MAG TPA: DeoR/GlpR family DNA-binding transcription regulator [Dongiaceae bacterium]|jgi:DeoR/GlpR family transcriptional regulator of sugar metabolism|nr:DeoR/GlpR family DNA-binding transcription regulator [Dongiaceae bacterium]
MTETKRIPKHERQKRILAKLRASNDLWIPGLVTSLDDIRHMHQEGLAERRAVAASVSPEPGGAEPKAVLAQRQKLAALAMRFIRPHMVIMIDGGATTLDLARRLAADALSITVITNSVPAAAVMGANPTINVTFCPGRYDSLRGSVDGPDTIRFLDRFRVNLAIFGACGITADGPNSSRSDTVPIKQAMLRRSEEHILLLDHTKFGRRHPRLVCPLGDIDRLICDEAPDGKLAGALRGANVDVHCYE